jgi:hypothetical protein
VANTTTTNTNGAYTFTRSESPKGVYSYYATFAGDTNYAPSDAFVRLPVGTLTPSTLTITTSNANPAVNQSFTLSGTLKAGSTSLFGKKITLGRTDPSGHWSVANTTTTNTNGAYTFTRSESAPGNYNYQASFAGDTYAPSNASVSLGIGNLQKAALTVFTTNTAPAVNQPYTLYGFLQNGVSGAHLAGQPVYLRILCPSGQYVNMATTTDTNGAYTFTRSESAQGTYIGWVYFWGNSSYLASSASQIELTVGNPIPTVLSLNITNAAPAVNQPFTIAGYLTDINGTTLSDKALAVWTRLPTGQWTYGKTATDSKGYYFLTISEQTVGQYRYEVHFLGDNTYAHGANYAEVAVGTLQSTNISANTNVINPGVGESYTLSGYLTDANGKPLSGQDIDLFQHVAGQQTQRGDIFETRYTDQNGYYFFVLNESASGNYKYTVMFMGDRVHAYSQAAVRLTVGTLTTTTLTMATSNANPAVNQSFTLSGTLKAGGTSLSGKKITLGRTDPSGQWSVVNTATTNTNGAYTFTRSESPKGVYSYYATFDGDTSHAPSDAFVRLTVGST